MPRVAKGKPVNIPAPGFGFCAALIFAALAGAEFSELLHGMFAKTTDPDPYLIAIDQWMPALTGVCLVPEPWQEGQGLLTVFPKPPQLGQICVLEKNP